MTEAYVVFHYNKSCQNHVKFRICVFFYSYDSPAETWMGDPGVRSMPATSAIVVGCKSSEATVVADFLEKRKKLFLNMYSKKLMHLISLRMRIHFRVTNISTHSQELTR